MHSDWKMLTSIGQLDEIDEVSETRPVAIFKHSTRCGISAGAEYRLLQNWGFDPDNVSLYHLDLLNYRSVSNAIAERYKVVHQSPQLIIIQNGKVVDQTSHHLVSADFIDQAIGKSGMA